MPLSRSGKQLFGILDRALVLHVSKRFATVSLDAGERLASSGLMTAAHKRCRLRHSAASPSGIRREPSSALTTIDTKSRSID
jgi:hypothetical protein